MRGQRSTDCVRQVTNELYQVRHMTTVLHDIEYPPPLPPGMDIYVFSCCHRFGRRVPGRVFGPSVGALRSLLAKGVD